MSKFNDFAYAVIACLVIIFAFVVPTVYTVMSYHHENTYTVKVTDKVIKRSGKTDHYLIYTENKNGEVRVFENSDAMFVCKFNSSDLQAKIKVGKTYQFETIGYRIPILSQYENVIEVK